MAPGGCEDTTTWPRYIVTSTTTGTTWYDYNYSGTYASTWVSPKLIPRPKSWRWFDRFRVFAKVLLTTEWVVATLGPKRVQERYPLLERARRKRQAFLRTLYG